MAMEWWRCKHNAPFDPKWRAIASEAQCRPGEVWAVFTVLCDRASQAEDRGSVAGFDSDEIAAGLDFDPEMVKRICNAMKRRNALHETRIANWDRHQPKRERNDHSSERVRSFRERQKSAENTDVTPRNDTKRHETPRVDKSRIDKKEEERGRVPRQPPSDPEPELGMNWASISPSDPDAPGWPKPVDLKIAAMAWNATAHETGLAQVKHLAGERPKHLALRLKELGSIGEWLAALRDLKDQPFLHGKNNRNWRANFDWFLKPANFSKVIERTYEKERSNGR